MSTPANQYRLHQGMDLTPSLSDAMKRGLEQSSAQANSLSEVDEFDNLHKVAMILLLVGPEFSAEVLRKLSPEDVQALSVRMAGMSFIDKLTAAKVLSEFKEITSWHAPVGGDIGSIMGVLGDKESLENATTLAGIEAVASATPEELYEVVRNEHPQIVASLMTFLRPEQTSAFVAMFPEDRRNELMLRVALLEKVDAEAIQVLNEVMMQLLGPEAKKSDVGSGGIAPTADILNYMADDMNKSAIDRIRDYDSDLAEAIIERMFSFEDFLDVADKSLETVLLEVPQDILIIALKGASPKLREKIFSNMTKRSAERTRDELDTLPPVKVSDVEDRQREMVRIARAMADKKLIVLQSGKHLDEFI